MRPIDPKSFADLLAQELADGWAAKARPNQLPPPGDDWFVWLLLAGRGFGKTRTLSEFVVERVNAGAAKRVALVAATAADARDVLVEGQSGILACAPDWHRPIYEPSKRRLTWPDGAIATTYSADEPERLRGPQHDLAAVDELGSWRRPEAWDNLMFGLRLGERPRCAVATTPRLTRLIRDLVAREGGDVVVTRGTSYENRANLAPEFISQIVKRYEGTRLGRQELMGELLTDVPGALWTHDQIEALRRTREPVLQRLVIAIDPSGSGDEEADETGIVAAGVDADGNGWVLVDQSDRYHPTEWAKRAVALYHDMKADRIVAETNFGGGMVEATIRAVDPNVSFRAVSASRGKVARAEPIAAIYEQGRVFHRGAFDALEDQMAAFTSNFDRAKAGFSPGRVDALVWALSDLMVQPMPSYGIFEYYRQKAMALSSDNTTKAEPPKVVYAKGSVQWQQAQEEEQARARSGSPPVGRGT
jgi:phage terminase large subunit-like protein